MKITLIFPTCSVCANPYSVVTTFFTTVLPYFILLFVVSESVCLSTLSTVTSLHPLYPILPLHLPLNCLLIFFGSYLPMFSFPGYYTRVSYNFSILQTYYISRPLQSLQFYILRSIKVFPLSTELLIFFTQISVVLVSPLSLLSDKKSYSVINYYASVLLSVSQNQIYEDNMLYYK